MVHNQQQANTYFDHPGRTSSGMPMYQGSYFSGFLFGHHTQNTRSPLPVFILRRSLYISLWLNSNIYHPKKTCSKPQRQKELEFQVNPNKKPTLTSSSSHNSVEDNKKKGQDIRIIKIFMASLLNNLSKPSETPNQNDLQPSSSRQIAKPVTSQIQVPVTTRPNQTRNLYQDVCNWRRIKHTKKGAKYQRNLFQR